MFLAQVLSKLISSGRNKPLPEEKDQLLVGKGSLGEPCSIFSFLEKLLMSRFQTPEFCRASHYLHVSHIPHHLFQYLWIHKHKAKVASSYLEENDGAIK